MVNESDPDKNLFEILKEEAKRYVQRCHAYSHLHQPKLDEAEERDVREKLAQERRLARSGSPRYDSNRHIALLQKLKAQKVKARLNKSAP